MKVFYLNVKAVCQPGLMNAIEAASIKIACIISVLHFGNACTAAPHFELRYSEPLAVFRFVENLSLNAPPNTYKQAFEKSRYRTTANDNLITRYDSLTVDYGYEYTAYPYAQKIGGSTESLLKKVLVNSSSIDQFRLNAIGIIPNNDLFKLCGILNAFQPVYDKLIYQPCHSQFDNQLKALDRVINTGRLDNYFEIGRRFYGSAWEDDIPFFIAVYPLTGSLHFSATAFYNNAE